MVRDGAAGRISFMKLAQEGSKGIAEPLGVGAVLDVVQSSPGMARVSIQSWLSVK